MIAKRLFELASRPDSSTGVCAGAKFDDHRFDWCCTLTSQVRKGQEARMARCVDLDAMIPPGQTLPFLTTRTQRWNW